MANTTEQACYRGRLESEALTPTGYAGWRWLQCTDIQDEYRVLIPPTIARCYAQLQEAEESELRIRPVDWEQIAALRHVRDRLIKRCYQLGKFRPGYEHFVKRSVFAPQDFTLRQLERWARDQNTLGFARPLKHRSSPISKAQTPSSPVSTITPSTRTTTTVTNTQSPSTPSTPLRPANSRHMNSAAMPTHSPPLSLRPANGLITPARSPSTPLQPANGPTMTPTPPTHNASPATSPSGCVYVVFRCPRHCPVEGCEKETQFLAPPNASHPVTDVLPPRVVPTQSQQKYGCQCYSPHEAGQGSLRPIMNTPTDIRQESLPSQMVNEGNSREPALNSSPLAPIALQLLTPEASTPMAQKPLPQTPPRDNLNFRQEKKEAFAKEETQTPTPVDEDSQQHSRPPVSSSFKTLRKQPSAADKEFMKQNPNLFSLPSSSSGQPLAANNRQHLDPNPPSNYSNQPPAMMKKGNERVLVVMNQSPQDVLSSPPTREERLTAASKGKGKENAVVPGETQTPTNPPPTNCIRVNGEDFLLVTPRKSTVKRHATYPEIAKKKKSVRFSSQTPSPIQQLPSRVIQPGISLSLLSEKVKPRKIFVARRSGPLIPQILITITSPSNSSEE